MAMLLHEFVPMVDNRLHLARRAVLGWSMGGYGALLAAETAAGGFRGVAAASAALWLTAAATAPGAFDGPADFAAHDVFTRVDRLAGTPTRLDCGTGDPFYAANRRLAALLPPPRTVHFGPGYHDPAFWRSVAPAQLRLLDRSLAG